MVAGYTALKNFFKVLNIKTMENTSDQIRLFTIFRNTCQPTSVARLSFFHQDNNQEI